MPEISFTLARNGAVEPRLGAASHSALTERDLHSPAFLEAVSGLLAAQRMRAWDHEAKDHNGQDEMFFGAALVRTANNRFYLAANIHQKNALTTRDCAEANAINQAAQDTLMHQLAITDVWFMGGKGNLSQGVPILPEEQGRRNCPCGSCLDVIANTNGGQNTRVHMLPLNHGDQALVLGGEAQAQPAANAVVTRHLQELFPQQSLSLPDAEGHLKQAIRDGWEWLQQEHPDQSHHAGRIRQLDDVAAADMPAAIQQILMETLHQEVSQASHKPLHKASLAMVRTNNGHFFMGTAFSDGRTMGVPSAVLNAIQNAGRSSISDVYILNADFRGRDRQLESFVLQPQADVAMLMPDGETRDRIWKARAKHESAALLPAPHVHLMALVPEHVFDAKRDMQSFAIESLLPFAFTSPKHDPMPQVYAPQHAGGVESTQAEAIIR